MTKNLLVVDIQHDFLPIPTDSNLKLVMDQEIRQTVEFLRKMQEEGKLEQIEPIYTAKYYPLDHFVHWISWQGQKTPVIIDYHGPMWPPHCI